MTTPPAPDQATPLSGMAAIAHALGKLDLDKVEQGARDEIASGRKSGRNAAVKTLQAVEGLKKNDMAPQDLTIKKVPVIPPMYRPFSVAGDTFLPGYSNELYKDVLNYRQFYSSLSKDLDEEGLHPTKYNLYRTVKALYGYDEPVNPKTRSRGVSGFMDQILGQGKGPKFSVFQRRLFSKTQDSVGRGVISAAPDLNMDEIGVPESTGWKLYAPYVMRRLVKGGMSRMAALQNIEDQTPIARKALDREISERPVIYSRAPAWHKYNVAAGKVKLTDGDNISANLYSIGPMGGDYDGDTVNLHLPSTAEAVEEAKSKLFPSKMLLSTKREDTIMPALKHEHVLGLNSAKTRPSENTHTFQNEESAMAGIRSGKVKLSDEIVIDPKHQTTDEPTNRQPSALSRSSDFPMPFERAGTAPVHG